MAEDVVGTLLSKKAESGKEPELSEREKQWLVIEETLADCKENFLADEELTIESYIPVIQEKLSELLPEEETEEENEGKVKAAVKARPRTLYSLGKEE